MITAERLLITATDRFLLPVTLSLGAFVVGLIAGRIGCACAGWGI